MRHRRDGHARREEGVPRDASGGHRPPPSREAFQVAQEGRPGPVLIDLPKDVQAETFDFTLPEQTYCPAPRRAAGLAGIEDAARLINGAERPLLIVGRGRPRLGGVGRAAGVRGAGERARDQHAARGVRVPAASPRSPTGCSACTGMFWNNIATTLADVIFGIGMRFDDRVIGRPGTFGPNAEIVHLDIEPSHIGKNVPCSVGLVGDVKLTLEELIPRMHPPPPPRVDRPDAGVRARPPQHPGAGVGRGVAAVRAARAQQDRRAQRGPRRGYGGRAASDVGGAVPVHADGQLVRVVGRSGRDGGSRRRR